MQPMTQQPPYTENRFTSDGVTYTYKVFSSYDTTFRPMATYGNVGDLTKCGDVVWVRHADEWKESVKGIDNNGRPLQRHPLINRRCLYDIEWKWEKLKKVALVESAPTAGPSRTSIPIPTSQKFEPVENTLFAGPSRTVIPNANSQNPSVRIPHPENEWMSELLKLWDSDYISSVPSLHRIGRDIIERLLEFSEVLPPFPHDELTVKLHGKSTCDIEGTLKLVIEDLISSRDVNVSEFINRTSDPFATAADVIASIINPTTHLDMSSPYQCLYGALDIPMTKKGLEKCNYSAKEYENSKKFLISDKIWTTTFTPPGAITHSHMDYYGRHQYFVHLFGKKLWLLWPPTAKNLEIFSNFHTRLSAHDTTIRCIGELEGLQLYYCKPGEVFVLQPNVIHACMCFATSSHTGTWVWALDTMSEAMRMIDWGINWLKLRSGDVGSSVECAKQEIYVLESDIISLKLLIDRNTSRDMDFSNELSRIQNFQGALNDVRKLYNIRSNNKRKRGGG